MSTPKNISIAYTPDSDDAFYYYALQCGRIPSAGFRFSFATDHIISLNRAARQRQYDIAAVSSVAYPEVAADYRILSVGTSVGRGYGPVLVGRKFRRIEELAGRPVGVAGLPTTGGFLFKWACPEAEIVEMQFDQIADAVVAGDLAAGVMIHEELLYYPRKGLHKIADLGTYWAEHTGLPLPVGLNIIRRDIGMETSNQLCDLIRESLLFALQHREEALPWACGFGRGEEGGCGEQHISMFANRDSALMPVDVRIALARVFQLTADLGITSGTPDIDIVDGSESTRQMLSDTLVA